MQRTMADAVVSRLRNLQSSGKVSHEAYSQVLMGLAVGHIDTSIVQALSEPELIRFITSFEPKSWKQGLFTVHVPCVVFP